MVRNILTVAAFSLALSGAAFAAENTEGPSAEAQAEAGGSLGIDMKAAGTTTESMTTFFKAMSAEDQKKVADRCADDTAMKGFTTEELKFCEATKAQ